MSTPPPPKHIIFVCTGNICRSPMAEALLRHALQAEPEPLRSLPVISAGLSAGADMPASANSVHVMRKVSIDIDNHRSRQLMQETLNNALAVFVMTDDHLATLRYFYHTIPAETYLMRGLMPDPHGVLEIDDPYGADVEEYEACRDSMVEAIPSIVARLRVLVNDAGNRP